MAYETTNPSVVEVERVTAAAKELAGSAADVIKTLGLLRAIAPAVRVSTRAGASGASEVTLHFANAADARVCTDMLTLLLRGDASPR